MAKRVLSKQRERILELYLQGYSRNAIGEIVDVSQPVISKHLIKSGYRLKSKPLNEKQVDEMEYFLSNGFAVKQIAEILDLSPTTIQGRLRQRGYSFSEKVATDEKQYIKSLWEKGYTVSKIMKETGRGWQTVKSHVAGE